MAVPGDSMRAVDPATVRLPVPGVPIHRNALPLASMLLEYKLESVLGAGGYGITYLAWDTNLEKHVAIKEYLPTSLALRALDGSVLAVNTENEYDYKWGLDRFIQEARTLAKFSHANIARVYRYFEANGTSYMVMDYEAGESLQLRLRRSPTLDEATLLRLLMPILDGLQAVHDTGFLHRDIKPSNVFIRDNGTPVLLDFGSARLATSNKSKIMTSIVSPGYAPLEQYSSTGRQGPWSDIYALSAVMYRAVTGENPSDAVKRVKSDDVPQMLAAAGTRYSGPFLKAVEWGMTVDDKLRPQNVADWRVVFLGGAAPSAARLSTGESAPVASAPAVERAPPRDPALIGNRLDRTDKWLIAGGIMIIVLALGAIAVKHLRAPASPPVQSSVPAGPQTTPQNAPR